MEKIPKIIHYVWMGNGKHSSLQKKCMKSWKKYCPDYEIKLWNEESFDLSKAPVYVQEAFKAKKWAFVSDFIRIWAVYNYGGLYFDTDTEVLKDISHLLENYAFLAFEGTDMVTTGVMGSCKEDKILLDILQYYEKLKFYNDDGTQNTIVTGRYVTEVFLKYGLKIGGQEQIVEKWKIYPFTCFYPVKVISDKTYYTEETCIVHWFEGTWFPEEYKKAKRHDKNPIIRFLRKIGLVKLYHKLIGKKQ